MSSHASPARMPRHEGFTLVELLCVVALMAIILALAAPSFAGLIRRQRMILTADEIRGTLNIARSEAIRRGSSIKIRKRDASEAKSCTTSPGDWSCGWIVVAGSDDGSLNQDKAVQDEGLLQSFSVPEGTSVRFTSNASFFTVNRWGAINGIGASFVVSPKNADTPQTSMIICISSGGRVRSAAGSNC